MWNPRDSTSQHPSARIPLTGCRGHGPNWTEAQVPSKGPSSSAKRRRKKPPGGPGTKIWGSLGPGRPRSPLYRSRKYTRPRGVCCAPGGQRSWGRLGAGQARHGCYTRSAPKREHARLVGPTMRTTHLAALAGHEQNTKHIGPPSPGRNRPRNHRFSKGNARPDPPPGPRGEGDQERK